MQNKSLLPKYYLKPGEMHFGREPVIVVTVLGSCLCITMYNSPTKYSAICHAVMPSLAQGRSKGQERRNAFWYVDSSIEWMFEQFRKKGIEKRDIEIKMFGGGETFTNKSLQRSTIAVGWKNISEALDILEKSGIRLKAWNIGGRTARRVLFHTSTGKVLIKYINKDEFDSIGIDQGRIA